MKLALRPAADDNAAPVHESGQMISHYRLIEKIGEGGMGVVWSAEDSVLKRTVAIKFLPAHVTEQPDRLARFEREAHLLAALNDPHISGIHGLEKDGDDLFLVLEHVPGETLAKHLKKGALPMERALKMASQLARAVDAAHERGILHRDLKPDNIKVTPGGQIKVLDFGLAKALHSEKGDAPAGREGTSEKPFTAEHVIVGTAPYMSPEQASGQVLDKRTDVWAFGCVLYEMLTGQRTFPGAKPAEILGAIMEREADWEKLPSSTPPRIRELLQRCLAKAPDERLRDVGDARLDIDDALADKEWTDEWRARNEAADRARQRSAASLAGIIAGTLLVVSLAAFGLGIFLWPTPATPRVVRFSITIPEGLEGPWNPQLSPDARYLAYTSSDPSVEDNPRRRRLFLHRSDLGEATPVPGSGGVRQVSFSPDSRWLAFAALAPAPATKKRIYKIPVDLSAPPIALMDEPENLGDLVWLSADKIVAVVDGWGYYDERAKLLSIPADGTRARPPVRIDAGVEGIDFREISPLPDGRHVLAKALPEGLATVDVETGIARFVQGLQGVFFPTYSPTGHLVHLGSATHKWWNSQKLFAVPFDVNTLERTGPRVFLADGVSRYSLAANGTLAYIPRSGVSSTWRISYVDQVGNIEAWSDDALFNRNNRFLSVSGDGSYLAVMVQDANTGTLDVWGSEVQKPGLRPITRLPKQLECVFQKLSFDGTTLVTTCHHETRALPEEGLYLWRTDLPASPELLLPSEESGLLMANDFSLDGEWLLYSRWPSHRAFEARDTSGVQLLITPVRPPEGGEPQSRVLPLRNVSMAGFSSDGRWLAYRSDRDTWTSHDVYVRRFHNDLSMGSETRITTGGTLSFLWSRESSVGKQALLFMTPDRRVVEVTIGGEKEAVVSEPREVMAKAPDWGREVGLLPDGRVLAVLNIDEGQAAESGPPERPRIEMVLNWTAEMKAKLAASSAQK